MFGFDPILASIVLLPAFYLLGVAIYHVYDVSFERRGDAAIRGLAFFFGILFITEVDARRSSSASITAWWRRPISARACTSA